MHILGTDLFYDIEFHDWSSGGNGGGFSYTRTPAELNTYDYPEDTIFFEKADYVDWQLEENQDRIAVNTWLTRGDQGGLFNAYSEEGYDTGSPENTEWFFGHTYSVYNEQYISWEELVDTSSGIIGQFISLHILSENNNMEST